MRFAEMRFNAYISFVFSKVLLTALVTFLCFSGCRRDVVDLRQPANEVWLKNIAYNPPSLTVKVNTTVIWRNKDGQDHTVTSNTGLFDSGVLHNGLTFSYTFTAAGTYPYQCLIHGPVMSGTVIVE